jgi:hypothetical protein
MFVIHLDDAVHKQKGIAMRQNLPDLVDVHDSHRFVGEKLSIAG